MRTLLVTYRNYYGHVSQDTINEFEDAIQADGIFAECTSRIGRGTGKRLLWLADRFPGFFEALYKPTIARKFSVIMGLEFYKCIWSFLFNRDNSMYCFDAWEANHPQIEQFIRAMRMRNVFFSSRQVTEAFAARVPGCRFQWVPEGITVENYEHADYAAKDIDVLAFGRKYDKHHEAIVEPLRRRNISYVYERQKGEIVFPTRRSFIRGLARSRISICVPSSITHPERAGSINTMTTRYLQSMASKCLVVGIMPEEMRMLFPYEPVIGIDPVDPAGQLVDILEHFDQYIPLIEKNYQYIRQHHSWACRWKMIRQAMEAPETMPHFPWFGAAATPVIVHEPV